MPLDVLDLLDNPIECRCHALVHGWRIVSFNEVRPVTVTFEQVVQLVVGDPGQHRWVSDLVPVQMKDREDWPPSRAGFTNLLGVPARSQRTGFGFAVADHTAHHKVRVVEGGAIGMWQGVPELAALVDRSRGLGCYVTGDPARRLRGSPLSWWW